jgi:GntR family transcriptional repressor for pyruvate dehydrogenase complex
VSEEIRFALMQAIRSGSLLPGAPVPPERELADEFGVARTSVREAIQGLFSLGLVERKGNRSYVTERLPGVSLDGADARKERVRELFEVRRIIEVPLAELTSVRATGPEMDEIRDIASQFSPGMALSDFRSLDRRFHWAVARACGNELLAELYGKVLASLFRSEEFDALLGAKSNQTTVRMIIATSTVAHQTIAEAVGLGDPAAAGEAVRHHLEQVESDMISRMD